MIIGIPKEIKPQEYRISSTPGGVKTLVNQGHKVYVENNAGIGSGFLNEEYITAGATILDTPAEIFGVADMIIKVKEPQPSEYPLFKEGQIHFTYLHLAPELELTKAMLEKKVVGIAYETIQLENGSLPLLTPMSEVAGRMSIQIGANFLQKYHGGKGILLGGVPGVLPAKTVIIGGGVVGTHAAKMALGLGAKVVILDNNAERLRYLDDIFRETRIFTRMSSEHSIAEEVREADLLIGAVLIPGAKAPHLVTEKMVQSMEEGSVIVDVAIDQGGCIETIDKITTHENPTYIKHGVVHYSVANMPGAVPRTSTMALSNVTLPYAIQIANKGYLKAVKENKALLLGVNVINGHLTYKAVADSLGIPYTPVNDML